MLLYDLASVLDDALVVGLAVVTPSRRRLSPRDGRGLQLASGLVLVGLGAWLLAIDA